MPGKAKDDPTKTQQQNAPTTPSQGDIRLPEEFDAAALWMSIPRKQREPATQAELAEKLGVNPDSITDWKKRDDFWEKVNGYRQSWVKEEISDVVAGLIKKAKHGAAPEVKLFLQFAGVYTETTRNEHTGKNGEPIRLTLADLVTQAAANNESDPDANESSAPDVEKSA